MIFFIMYKYLVFEQMAPVHTLALCNDAFGTCLEGFIHKSDLVRDKYPNILPTMRFTDLQF